MELYVIGNYNIQMQLRMLGSHGATDDVIPWLLYLCILQRWREPTGESPEQVQLIPVCEIFEGHSLTMLIIS